MALQTFTLAEEVGLYQPSIVHEIQEKYRFKPLTSDIHCIEAHYDVAAAWEESSDLVSNEEYYTHFSDSVYGKDLRVVRPVVEFTEKASSPHWTSPPVPFCYHADPVWGM